MPIEKPIVFFIDDDPSVLQSQTSLLAHYGLDVRAYSNASAFLESYRNEHGCLVLDLSLPDIDGLQLQAELNRLNISIPIIFISGHGAVPDCVQALKAGALDFLQKPFRKEQLLERIDEAIMQDAEQRKSLQQLNNKKKQISTLTVREKEIFKVLISNEEIPSSKEIARMLNISHRTVEHHRSRILDKTGASTIVELRITFELKDVDKLLETNFDTYV